MSKDRDNGKRADALLAECETHEDTRELIEGFLDALEGIKALAEKQISYMERLEDDGEQPKAEYVQDAFQDMIYTIEDAL